MMEGGTDGILQDGGGKYLEALNIPDCSLLDCDSEGIGNRLRGSWQIDGCSKQLLV